MRQTIGFSHRAGKKTLLFVGLLFSLKPKVEQKTEVIIAYESDLRKQILYSVVGL